MKSFYNHDTKSFRKLTFSLFQTMFTIPAERNYCMSSVNASNSLNLMVKSCGVHGHRQPHNNKVQSAIPG